MTISKVERGRFRFTGLDILRQENSMVMSMEDYVRSLEDITEIWKADSDEPLTRLELKEYRKMTGKIAWLANFTHPDLSFTALQLAKKNNCATISDLRNLNIIL